MQQCRFLVVINAGKHLSLTTARLRKGRRARNEGNDVVDGVGESEQVAEFLLLSELEEKRIDGLALVFGGIEGD